MRRRPAVLNPVLPFAGLAVLVALSRPAAACTCSFSTSERTVRDAPAIFEGVTIAVERSGHTREALGGVTATVEVLKRWKGEALPNLVTMHGHTSGASCGYSSFPLETPLLVLAYPTERPGEWTTGMCSVLEANDSRYNYQLRRRLRTRLIRYRSMLERLDGAIAAFPDDPAKHLAKARFLDRWNDLAGAAAAYAAAAQRAPEQPLPHFLEGRALFASRRFDAALAPLRRASLLRPSDREAAKLLGQARVQTGDLSDLASVDFRGLDAHNLDLSGSDLRGQDFSGVRAYRARFVAADLRGARFHGAQIALGSMAGADLRGAKMVQVSAWRVAFSGANLEGADFGGADLDRADFSRARLAGTSFTGAQLRGATFDYADLRGADLSRADLRGASFDGASLDCRTRVPRDLPENAARAVPPTDDECRGAVFGSAESSAARR